MRFDLFFKEIFRVVKSLFLSWKFCFGTPPVRNGRANIYKHSFAVIQGHRRGRDWAVPARREGRGEVVRRKRPRITGNRGSTYLPVPWNRISTSTTWRRPSIRRRARSATPAPPARSSSWGGPISSATCWFTTTWSPSSASSATRASRAKTTSTRTWRSGTRTSSSPPSVHLDRRAPSKRTLHRNRPSPGLRPGRTWGASRPSRRSSFVASVANAFPERKKSRLTWRSTSETSLTCVASATRGLLITRVWRCTRKSTRTCFWTRLTDWAWGPRRIECAGFAGCNVGV